MTIYIVFIEVKMKILFLTNIPSPYRVEFFSRLGKFIDLTVIYELRVASNRDPSWRAIGTEITHKEIYLESTRVISDGGISTKVFSYLNGDYDFIIVGTHGTPTAKLAILYMRLKGIPYILNIDGMLSCELDDKNWLNKKLRKWLFLGAMAYFTSGYDTDEYVRRLGIQGSFYHYHFSSISEKDVLESCNFASKDKVKSRLGIKEQHLLICVARFIPIKGIDSLLRVFNKINRKDIGLVLVGGEKNVYENILREFPESVQERLYFPGFMGKEKLMEYYSAADIFVLPTHHDEWGLVVNEAMGMGLPVVTTNKCGAGLEIIQDGENGYVVSDNNENELRNRIEFLIDNKTLREAIAVKNLKIARQYTIEMMVKDHIDNLLLLKKG